MNCLSPITLAGLLGAGFIPIETGRKALTCAVVTLVSLWFVVQPALKIWDLLWPITKNHDTLKKTWWKWCLLIVSSALLLATSWAA